MSAKEAKQRLMALRVGEVSLVDNPANEEEFLVVKNLEDKMSDVERVESNPETEPPASEEQDVEKAIKVLVTALEKAKSKTAKEFPPGFIPGKPGKKPDEDEMPVDQQKALPPPLMAAMKKLMDMMSAMMEKAGKPYPYAEEGKRKNLDAEPESGTTVHVSESGEIIVKSKKFTGERLAKIKDALGPLLQLMKEVDPEGFATLMAAGVASGTPGGELPAVATHSMPTGIQKSLEPIAESITKMMTVVEGVAKRVEALETGTAVTKTLPAGGNDNPTAPKKSIWANVL